MNDFDYDVLQKKRIANQARYRKCGSKSKKCPMSTDYMTRKQWEKRCGEVMTYQLRKPMIWKDFKAQPAHIQKLYIEDIVNTYHATATDLARMFGVTSATVLRCCGDDGLQIHFVKGKRMNKEQQERFERFLLDEDVDPNVVNVDTEPAVIEETHDIEAAPENMAIDINSGKQSVDMAMTSFGLSFSGKFNKDMLYNSIASMLPIGTQVKIDIQCTIEG